MGDTYDYSPDPEDFNEPESRCMFCGTKIYFVLNGSRWKPMNKRNNKPHMCKQMAPTAVEEFEVLNDA